MMTDTFHTFLIDGRGVTRLVVEDLLETQPTSIMSRSEKTQKENRHVFKSRSLAGASQTNLFGTIGLRANPLRCFPLEYRVTRASESSFSSRKLLKPGLLARGMHWTRTESKPEGRGWICYVRAVGHARHLNRSCSQFTLNSWPSHVGKREIHFTPIRENICKRVGVIRSHPYSKVVLSVLASALAIGLAARYLSLWPKEPPNKYTPTEGKDPLPELLSVEAVNEGMNWERWKSLLTDHRNAPVVYKEVVPLIKECRGRLRWGGEAPLMPGALRGLARVLDLDSPSLQKEALEQLIDCLSHRLHWGKADFDALCEVEGFLTNLLVHREPRSPIRDLAAQAYYLAVEAICFSLEGINEEAIDTRLLTIRIHASYLKYKVLCANYEHSPLIEYELLAAHQMIKQGTTLGSATQVGKIQEAAAASIEAGTELHGQLQAKTIPRDIASVVEKLKQIIGLVYKAQGQLDLALVDQHKSFELLGKLRLYMKMINRYDEHQMNQLLDEIAKLLPQDEALKASSRSRSRQLDPRAWLTSPLPGWVTFYGITDLLSLIASSSDLGLAIRRRACDYLEHLLKGSEIPQVNWRLHSLIGQLPPQEEELERLIAEKQETFKNILVSAKESPTTSLQGYWEAICPINKLLPEIDYAMGRKRELHHLERGLFNSPRSIVVLEGLGGIGKSTLSEMYVKSHRKDYGGIWILDAENTATLCEDLERLFPEDFVGSPGSSRVDSLLARFDEQLATSVSAGRQLVILENIPHDASLLAPHHLKFFYDLAEKRGVHLLFHAQTTAVQEGLGCDREPCVLMNRFDEEEAVTLFLDIFRRRNIDGAKWTRKDAHRAVKLIGYIPLAVVQTAIYAAKHDKINYEEFVEGLQASGFDVHQASDPKYAKQTIQNALDLTLRELEQDETIARTLLGLTLCHPDEIDLKWLECVVHFLDVITSFEKKEKGWSLKAVKDDLASHTAGTTTIRQYYLDDLKETRPYPRRVEPAVLALREHFLLRRMSGKSGLFYSVPREVQDVILRRMDAKKLAGVADSLSVALETAPLEQELEPILAGQPITFRRFIEQQSCFRPGIHAQIERIFAANIGVDPLERRQIYENYANFLSTKSFAIYFVAEFDRPARVRFARLEDAVGQILGKPIEGRIKKVVSDWISVLRAFGYILESANQIGTPPSKLLNVEIIKTEYLRICWYFLVDIVFDQLGEEHYPYIAQAVKDAETILASPPEALTTSLTTRFMYTSVGQTES